MKTETFDQGIALLIATFRDLKVNKEQLKTWRILLAKMEDEEFMSAVLRICKTEEQIFPGTNLVAIIQREADNSNSESIMTAEAAWSLVQSDIEENGYSKEPTYLPDDSEPKDSRWNQSMRLCRETVATIGWRNLCSGDVHSLNTQRAHFFRIFESFQKEKRNDIVNKEVRELIGTIVKQLPEPKK